MVEKIPKIYIDKFRNLIFLTCLVASFFLPVQKNYSQFGNGFPREGFVLGVNNQIYAVNIESSKFKKIKNSKIFEPYEGKSIEGNGGKSLDIYKTNRITDKKKSLYLLSDTDGDGINDSIDLDDDNDGILDVLESRICSLPGAKMEEISFNFESGVNGDIANVPLGMNTVGITGVYTNGRKKPNNFSTNLGQILQMAPTGNTNAYSLNYPTYSPVTPSGNYSASGSTGSSNPFPLILGVPNKVFNAATFSSAQSGGVYTLDSGTPKTPSSFSTTVDVSSFEFRKNLNQLTIYPSFVVEYDFFQANGSGGNEPGVYISNGVNDNLWANTGTSLKGFYTYRANSLYKVNAAPFTATGTLVVSGDNPIDIVNASNSNKWYHQKVTFSLNNAETILTITVNTQAYDLNGNLTGLNYQRSWTNAVDLLGNENWLRNFTAGISTDGVIDNVQTYYLVCDSDNDGVANHLDLDSDNDGCVDAIEGDELIVVSQLSSDAISGSVDANGVPNLVNLGGGADVGGDQGQGSGQTYIVNPGVVGGTISTGQTICAGTAPTPLVLSGSIGTIQWQSSLDNSVFTNISGATSATYSPGALMTTNYYRTVLTSIGGCTSITPSVAIIIEPLPTAPVIGAITQPSCAMATGSVALSGLPASGT
ncbi:hypothetical protein V3Q90_13900, partial [Flavobacterium oreochromis]